MVAVAFDSHEVAGKTLSEPSFDFGRRNHFNVGAYSPCEG
jgi:hypothetical protein